jgi:hypothetical protein
MFKYYLDELRLQRDNVTICLRHFIMIYTKHVMLHLSVLFRVTVRTVRIHFEKTF